MDTMLKDIRTVYQIYSTIYSFERILSKYLSDEELDSAIFNNPKEISDKISNLHIEDLVDINRVFEMGSHLDRISEIYSKYNVKTLDELINAFSIIFEKNTDKVDANFMKYLIELLNTTYEIPGKDYFRNIYIHIFENKLISANEPIEVRMGDIKPLYSILPVDYKLFKTNYEILGDKDTIYKDGSYLDYLIRSCLTAKYTGKIGQYAYYSNCMLEALKGNASIFTYVNKDDYTNRILVENIFIYINHIPSKVLEYLVEDGVLEEQYNKIDIPNVQSKRAYKNIKNIRNNLKTLL